MAWRCSWLAVLLGWAAASVALADGEIVPPRDYKGSLEEQAQEAIIIFQGAEEPGEATEDIILKIRVEGHVERFAWIIPFPSEPTIAKEDPKLFEELYAYVAARRARPHKKKGKYAGGDAEAVPAEAEVEVLSRKVVGSFDTVVVREKAAGALNRWLEQEGFQTLADAEDVIGFYRQKGYVFACIKVSDVELEKDKPIDSHPLRFSFKTGGRDGIFYPMKMTGLQSRAFDVNLCVFYRAWLNDRLNKFGYVHRGFVLHYRDWDTPACKPNAGKTWSDPEGDPFLRSMAGRIPTVKALFQKLHPGERYYLTNLQARRMVPAAVRQWPDDLWLFPYYTRRGFVPFDARPGGCAAGAYRAETGARPAGEGEGVYRGTWAGVSAVAIVGLGLGVGLVVLVAGVVGCVYFRKQGE